MISSLTKVIFCLRCLRRLFFFFFFFRSGSRVSRDLFPSAMLGWYQRCRPFPARRNVFQFVLTGAEKGGRHSRLRSTASRVILVKREAYERRPPRLIPWFYSLRPIRRTRRGCKHRSEKEREREGGGREREREKEKSGRRAKRSLFQVRSRRSRRNFSSGFFRSHYQR